ncbi:hypothetical protein [Marinobacter shengliensis]|uniref:hypothetical protein n=1 Tax=Marinobacter shengliensis TaxID=1389223 RepID=UPI0011096AFB|nr:hypothetical protein [Marinobacter shengliensis]
MDQQLKPRGAAILAILTLLAGCANLPGSVPEQAGSALPEYTSAEGQLADKSQTNGPTGRIVTADDAVAFRRIGTLGEPYALSIKAKTAEGVTISPSVESIHTINVSPEPGRLLFKDSGRSPIEIVSISLHTEANGTTPIGEQLPVVVVNAETQEPFTKLVEWTSIEQIEFDPIDQWMGLPATRIETGLNPSATWRQEARFRFLKRQAERATEDASKRGVLKSLLGDGPLPDSIMRQLATMLTSDAESPDCEVRIETGVADLVAHINNHLKCLQARKEIMRLQQGVGISSEHTPLTTIYLMGIIESPVSE